ncbi:uncharacterized protein EI97DRAFT_431912 [Westerdykella ornata]|uniref:PPP4R2-domain-containing protein n=1 Tax=Westerdykella ornata TaxID=318751 RepID=A0A6A6JQ88_WESOR|nr:uncharacterized protein EI97DRAFT_431912 [Westerdykella ornata]KAF2277846.1 hypothetical protein EI97DRAFT_431912 [Westerdykella ornata]
MASPQDLLARAAADGTFDTEDPDAWPRTLKYILHRLDENFNSFPKPVVPSNARSHSPLSNAASAGSSQQSHTSDKENAPPATLPRVPNSAFSGTPPPSQPESPNFPEEWITLCDAIRTSLTKNFSKYPPHTLQRLAELVLEPKKHYRFLPPYLRALDRVVSVTSSTTIFPFPHATLPTTAGFLNGTITPPQSTLGSDESLGGALLTPIPWLANRQATAESTEMVDAPRSAGRIETVAVVNGQLISQDDANSALSNPTQDHPKSPPLEHMESDQQGAGDTVQEEEHQQQEEEETPHARGPEEIGMEDTGPQRGSTPGRLDFEGAVGKPRSPRRSPDKNGEGETKDQDMGDGEELKNETVSEQEKMEEDAILQADVKDHEMQEVGQGKADKEKEEGDENAAAEAM